MLPLFYVYNFFFNDTATTEIYTYGHTLSLHDALPIFDGNQPAEPDQHRRNVPGLLGHDDRPVVLHVDGKRLAVAVDDIAARRRQQPRAYAVLVGQHPVTVGLVDLQVVKPRPECAEQRELAAGGQGRAAAEEPVPVLVGGHRNCASAPGSVRWACPRSPVRGG